MSEGLLVRLRRYRPRDGRDSLEDFVTEAFAWLLESDSDFQDVFLELVNGVLEQNGVPVPMERGDSVSWQTQESFEDCRFDLVGRLPEALLLFEHKVWADATESQMSKYRDAAERLAAGQTARVLMITANALQHQNADACLCWKDVYRLIDRHRRNESGNPESDRYLQDSQDLLLHEGWVLRHRYRTRHLASIRSRGICRAACSNPLARWQTGIGHFLKVTSLVDMKTGRGVLGWRLRTPVLMVGPRAF